LASGLGSQSVSTHQKYRQTKSCRLCRTSSMECVVRRIARPFARSASRMFQTPLLVSGSRPVVGSSATTIFGSAISAMPSDSLRFMPPLRAVAGCRKASPSSLTAAAMACTQPVLASDGTPLSSANSSRCSSTVQNALTSHHFFLALVPSLSWESPEFHQQVKKD
jgi:hypothetical protein